MGLFHHPRSPFTFDPFALPVRDIQAGNVASHGGNCPPPGWLQPISTCCAPRATIAEAWKRRRKWRSKNVVYIFWGEGEKLDVLIWCHPILSMYMVYIYIYRVIYIVWLLYMGIEGKYTIHGSYGPGFLGKTSPKKDIKSLDAPFRVTFETLQNKGCSS